MPGIQAKVLAMMKRMERGVAAALGESAQAAHWPAKRRAEAALTLTNAYVGLRVLARSGVSAQGPCGGHPHRHARLWT